MSQKYNKEFSTNYCPLIGIRVAIGKDNMCVNCLPKKGIAGEILAMRGVVVGCTNGDGELVSNNKDISTLNNLEGMARSEKISYFMNLAKTASQWINFGKDRAKKSVI